jgi:mannose-6-phosphate isomerase-like protein (cupin superfamily)
VTRDSRTDSAVPSGPWSAPVSLDSAFARIGEHWSPRVAAELNGQQVKLARIQGAFVWHHHADEDELFLVWKGTLRLELRDTGPRWDHRLPDSVTLEAGDLFVVPRGVDHRPVAEQEVQLVMFEPASTLNTGNVRDERTVERPEAI